MHVPVIFISHSWSNSSAYKNLCEILDVEFGGNWDNVSITQNTAIAIVSKEHEIPQRRHLILTELEHIEKLQRIQTDRLLALRNEHAWSLHEAAGIKDYLRRESIRAELFEQILDPGYAAKTARLERLERKYCDRDVEGEAERLARRIQELAGAVREAENLVQRLERENRLQLQLLAKLDNILEPLIYLGKGRIDYLLEKFGALALSIRARLSRSHVMVIIAETDSAYRQWIEFEYQAAFDLGIPTLAVVSEGEQLSPDLRGYGIASTSWSEAGQTLRRYVDGLEPRH